MKLHYTDDAKDEYHDTLWLNVIVKYDFEAILTFNRIKVSTDMTILCQSHANV